MIGEETPPLRLGKVRQISAPSDEQIIDLLEEMTYRVSQRRRFNGHAVNKQLFVNNIIVGLAKLGPETFNYVFDEGASILGPALMAGEPGVPIAASRPLKKRFSWFDGKRHESDEEPIVKPLPSVTLTPKRNPENSGGGKGQALTGHKLRYCRGDTRDARRASPPNEVSER